jgi:hypothetical protein
VPDPSSGRSPGDAAGWPPLPGKIANGGRDDLLTVVGVMQIDQRGALPETAAAHVRLHDGVHLLQLATQNRENSRHPSSHRRCLVSPDA